EGIFKTDNGRPARVGARNLNRVLDGLSTRVHKHGLLGKIARRNFVQALSESDVSLVGKYVEAGMQEAIELPANGFHHAGGAVPCVEASDAAGEIDHAIAIDVFDDGAF